MDLKISSCTGFALPVLLLSVALAACGDKTTTSNAAPTAVTLARYNATGAPGTPGTPDTGFGTQGVVMTDVNGSQDDIAFAVVVQPVDGKIIAVGSSFTAPASGVLDTTTGFGGGTGIVTTQIGAGDADVAALAVQPLDGKIVAAGLAGNAVTNVWDVALLRYNTDGTLDLPFGGTNTGMVITDIGSSSNYANAVALQADGKIVVAGNAFANPSANTSDIAVLRYNADGSLDTAGFASPNGYVTTSVGAFDNGYAVAVQPSDGKIVVAGNADAGVGDRLALLRYNADGGLDSGFGTGGIVTSAASGPSIIAGAFGVALQPADGAIVVVGYD